MWQQRWDTNFENYYLINLPWKKLRNITIETIHRRLKMQSAWERETKLFYTQKVFSGNKYKFQEDIVWSQRGL